MPYVCVAGDDRPPVVILQKLDDDYAQEPLCDLHFLQFIRDTYEAMFPAAAPAVQNNAAPDDAADSAPAGPDDPQDEDEDEATRAPAPVGAATTDQRPDEDDPAPY